MYHEEFIDNQPYILIDIEGEDNIKNEQHRSKTTTLKTSKYDGRVMEH